MKKDISLKNTIKFNNRLFILLTTIPILLMTLFFFTSIRQYQHIVENVNEANNIMKNCTNNIERAVWYIVIGKPEETNSPESIIKDFKNQLYNLSEKSTSIEQQQTAFIGIRTLDSIENYVNEININIENNQPVIESEILLDEIRNVSEVFDETLQEYVMTEINLSNQKSSEIMNGFYLFCSLEVFLVILIIILVRYNDKRLNERINRPIDSLTKMVTQVADGDLSARTEKPGIDELDILADSLNKMATQLNLLFFENTEKQKNLAKSEMRVLQAQITPHFIYNSLDAVLTLSQKGEMTRVNEIIRALSSFFKITLNKGNEWVTVKQEFTHVKNYLQILKVRYQSLLEYEIALSSEIENMMTLKMLLQPLIENAMYHGIKNSRRGGVINISGYQNQGYLVFEVTDNGIGIQPHELAKINQQMKNSGDTVIEGGYGLFNVYRRLKLFYGDSATLKIVSEYQKGTTITISFPQS